MSNGYPVAGESSEQILSRHAVVVGAGILGLSSAYHLCRAGYEVTVLEKDAFPREASARNFGMVWPIGQPLGDRRDLAMASRSHWLAALETFGIWFDTTGSLHVFTDPLEAQVATEWVESMSDPQLHMVTPTQIAELSPLVRADGVIGGLYSPYEVCVDPRSVNLELARGLEAMGVRFCWECAVGKVSQGRVETSRGTFEGSLVVVCPGASLAAFYPDLYTRGSARLCRLHMLRARPMEGAPAMGPMLCSGLTLLHYKAFSDLPSLPALRELMQFRFPRQLELGIHGLVSQHGDGTLTLGDSHEYGHQFPPYEPADVDDAILCYLDTFIDLRLYPIQERWTGVYCQSTTDLYLSDSPEPGVLVIGSIGGAGMTLSFGVTARALEPYLASPDNP